MNNSQIIADRIKEAAKRNGITVKALLEDCELGKNTVGKIANGTDIGIQTLTTIADYLGVSVDYLLGREIKNAPDDKVRGDIIERIRSLSEADAEKLRILVETVFPDPDGE